MTKTVKGIIMIEIRSDQIQDSLPIFSHTITNHHPRYQYPLEEHARENAAEDARCLAMAEETIEASEAR